MTGAHSPKDRTAIGDLLDRLLPSRRESRRLAADYARLEAFAHSIPLEYCGWDKTGAQAMSPGFAAMLGVANIATLEDLQAAFAPGDAAAIEGLYDRLANFGEPFEIGLYAPHSQKTLKVFGKRGTDSFSVIWVMDISDMADAARQGIDAITTVERRENELRASLNALPFPVWIRNENLDITWCNKSYAQAVDDTAATVIADQKELPFTGANKADMTQRVLAQKALGSLQAQRLRGHLIVEGQRRLVEMMEVPMAQEKRVVGVALDVTKEEEWAKSYDRLASSHKEAMEQLRTAIAMFDADMRLEFYNSAYEHLTGMSGTWLDTKPKIAEIIDKLRELRKTPEQADFKQFKQQWINRFTSLLEPYEEMQYLPDGSVVRMIIVPRPMGGLLVTQEDVTSRLQLETSYNTLIAVQQETIDNLAEGIAVFGEDGRVRLANQSFARIWNFPVGEVQGTPHITGIVDRLRGFFDQREWTDMRELILSNALERDPRKGRIRRNDGSVLEYSTMPLPDGNILNAWFDVTDTVKVEQVLMEKNAALEAAEKLKTDFLANVSYQLRTPLNAIMGFAEMLHQQYPGKLNERQIEYTGSMIEAGQRLVSLINDILDLSTLEAGYMTLNRAGIDVRMLIAQVVELTQDWARKQKIEMSVDAESALILEADERRLKQVLLNLISNAINYSPNGGRITVAAKKREGFVDLSVSDTGMGIPKADLARIFTPFEKIHDRTTQRRSGAGLGLALVKNIVELHGGIVAISSIEGQGTTVTCSLPIK